MVPKVAPFFGTWSRIWHYAGMSSELIWTFGCHWQRVTLQASWQGYLSEAERMSDIHNDIKMKLLEEVQVCWSIGTDVGAAIGFWHPYLLQSQVKTFQKDNFQKTSLPPQRIKQTKDFEDKFTKVSSVSRTHFYLWTIEILFWLHLVCHARRRRNRGPRSTSECWIVRRNIILLVRCWKLTRISNKMWRMTRIRLPIK